MKTATTKEKQKSAILQYLRTFICICSEKQNDHRTVP